MMPFRLIALLVPAVWLAASMPAQGQTDLDRFERQIEQIQRQNERAFEQALSPLQRTQFDVGGYYTISYMAIDDAAQKTHQLMQHDLGVYARLNVENVHELFVRGSVIYRDYKTGDAFDQHGDDWIGPRLDRAIYRFDLRNAMAAYADKDMPGNVVIQLGRQLAHWGNGLAFSQDIDGGILQLSYDPVSLEFLAGVIRHRVTDLEPYRINHSDPSRRGFYGAKLGVDVTSRHHLFAYALFQEDNNDDPDRVDNILGTATTTRFGYDSHYIGLGAQGSLTDRLLYSVEAVYQGGKTYSSSFLGNPYTGPVSAVTQTRDRIQAYALDLRLDYLLTDPNQTRFSGELVIASGDGDRVSHTTSSHGGNHPGTTDRAFNAFGLTNTGLAFAPNVSNLVLIRAGVSTTPLPNLRLTRQLQVGMDLLVFNKLVPNGPINENTADTTYLGTEADFYANWRMTSDLSLSVRYGIFFPGKALAHAPDGYGSDPRHFLYTGLTLSF